MDVLLILIVLVAAAILVLRPRITVRTGRMTPDTAPVSGFCARPLLNGLEMRTYLILNRWVETRQTDLHVSAQAAMGEFIGHPDFEEYRRVNTKRVDFALFDSTGRVRAVVEADGRGHFGVNAADARRAEERDTLKNQVLAQAKIPLIRLTHGMSNGDIYKALDTGLTAFVDPEIDTPRLRAAR
ncbi:MAG: hypothetical protein DI634_09320 [Kocuria palustris]|nr:MAG: hypothetical protein DI634_09320 [Kocuria palustris]